MNYTYKTNDWFNIATGFRFMYDHTVIISYCVGSCRFEARNEDFYDMLRMT